MTFDAYGVVNESSLWVLETGVNRHLKEGWVPVGGICVLVDEELATRYLQAIALPHQGTINRGDRGPG